MAIIRFEPQRNLGLVGDFGRVLDSMFDPFAKMQNGLASFNPAMDIVEKDDSYLIHADLPGVEDKDLSIEVEDNWLTISGKRESIQEEKHEGYYRTERSFGSFMRNCRLPQGVDSENIKASFKDGVLELVVPKPAVESRKKRIEIESGNSDNGTAADHKEKRTIKRKKKE